MTDRCGRKYYYAVFAAMAMFEFRVSRVKVTLTVTVRVGRFSVMVGVRDSV